MLTDLSIFGEIIRSTKTDDYYNCPFCQDLGGHLGIHRQRGCFHCFKCNAAGKLKDLPYDLKNFEATVRNKLSSSEPLVNSYKVELPYAYKPITSSDKYPYSYLVKRGITEYEIKKYKLGFCSHGFYGQRIIIPIYNSHRLVYFVGRTYMKSIPKYMNSPVAKAGIVFTTEQEPVEKVVITEGIFDAFQVGKLMPAIALLGKTLNGSKQIETILKITKQAIVLLDSDAWKDGFKVYETLREYLPTKLVLLQDKDPGATKLEKLEEVLSAHL